MKKTIEEIAQSLIGRNLSKEDGIDNYLVEKAENRLGIKFPAALKNFYTSVGNMEIFTSSFECFVHPDELEMSGDKLIFLEENQGVCFWAISAGNNDEMVYMCTDIEEDEPEWYPEVSMEEFLKVVMYLQCAQGGFEYGSAVYESNFADRKEYEQYLEETTQDWDKVVEHNGFVAFQKDDKLIWYFYDKDGKIDDILYASTRTEERQKELDEYGFQEL
ncbi:MAG: SMI1/KNR4 family protein [Bacteroidales bacterium]|jgi:hypothetical protein|nr:SMI1/KNR4 family protein [Bacteroidales bacterium]